MPYASLSEIYGASFANSLQDKPTMNKYDEITNNIVNYNKDTQYSVEGNKNIENFYDIDQENLENLDSDSDSDSDSDDEEEENYQDEPFGNQDSQYCNRFLYHLSICGKCREFIRKKFGSERKIVEVPRKSNQDEFLDIALYIITGIFMLFLLDLFLKLGKFLGKK